MGQGAAERPSAPAAPGFTPEGSSRSNPSYGYVSGYRPNRGGEVRQFEILCLAVRSGKLAQPTQQHAFFLGLHFLDLQGEDFDRLRIHVWNLLNP